MRYLEEHEFHARNAYEVNAIVVRFGNRQHPLAPSGKRLRLNRITIRKYTLPRDLSPLKAYGSFDLDGHLSLADGDEGSCRATLHFAISAYEAVWLPVWDDGYRSKFLSNGTLERLYLDAIAGLFTAAKPGNKP